MILQQLLCVLYIGIINTEKIIAGKKNEEIDLKLLLCFTGLKHVTISYIVSLNELHNGRQHTNCSNTKINSLSVLMCSENSTLFDGNIGDSISQSNEEEKYFI